MKELYLGFKRWARSLAEVSITLLLIFTILVVPLASSTAQMLVRKAVSDNWRGAYDILVLGKDSPLVSTSEGKVRIEPNYGVLTSSPIGQEKVEQLAKLPNVEVSAPIGFIGSLADSQENVTFQIPVSYIHENPLVVMRAEYVISANDGITERRVSSGSMEWRIDARHWDGQPAHSRLQNPTLNIETSLQSNTTWVMTEDFLTIYLGNGPHLATLLTAVDPVAEAQLLGEHAPAGLGKLTEFEAVVDTAYVENDYIVPLRELTGDEPWLKEIEELAPEFITSYAAMGRFTDRSKFVPVLYAEGVYPQTRIKVRAETVTIDGADGDQWLVESIGQDGEEIFSLDEEITGDIRPLGHSSYSVVLGGKSQDNIQKLLPANFPQGTGRSTISPLAIGVEEQPSASGVPSTVEGLGEVTSWGVSKADPKNSLEGDPDGTLAGQTTVYRETALYDRDLNMSTRPGDESGTAPVFIGGYNPSQIAEAYGQSVPLGAYSVLTASRITDGNGSSIPSQTLAPTFTGRGLVAQPATALISLDTAQDMGVEAPVTAVRLRLSDSEEYNDENIARLQATVQEIESMGLSAYIVAGASTVYEEAWVGTYAFGTDQPKSFQTVAPLGIVELPYTELGVAGDIVHRLARLTQFLVLTAFLLALGSLLVLLFLHHRAQRTQMSILHSQGVSAGGRWRYLMAERSPTLLVLLCGAVASTWLAVPYRTSVFAGTLGTALIMAGILGMVAVQATPAQPPKPSLGRVFPLGILMPTVIAFLSVLLAVSYVFIPEILGQVEETDLGKKIAEQSLPVFTGLVLLSFLTTVVIVAAAWGTGLSARTSALKIRWEQGQTRYILMSQILKEWLLALIISLLIATGLYFGTKSLVSVGGGMPSPIWVWLLVGACSLPLLLLYIGAMLRASKVR